MSLRALCIHAHFYQPPREDPLSGKIPIEHGATPYRNWNEKIHSECYRPNIELGNFRHISFNIGPTLVDWMQGYDPDSWQKIVREDTENITRHGVGNAIAQPYNHTILPLATSADKETQIRWGIADFKHRFGHKPEGMWLPETAVDLESLNILAEQGIQFTILAPWQADTEHLDPTEPYQVALSEGKQITVFFYQQDLSGGISFNPALTDNADEFAMGEVSTRYSLEKSQRGEPQLMLIATDGELYGHHQHFKDRFLAHLLNGASSQLGIMPTYPALWLKDHPVRQSIQIREFTSWSCYHGVARWQTGCECTPGDGRWKDELRRAFIQLATELDGLYADTLKPLDIDPWQLRNEYIHVMLGEVTLPELLNRIARRRIEGEHIWRIRLLLEAQRERQRIFTSCGWYYDDFSRIEPMNNVAYAAQALHLAKVASGIDLSPQIRALLRQVISERTGIRGDTVLLRFLGRCESLITDEPNFYEHN